MKNLIETTLSGNRDAVRYAPLTSFPVRSIAAIVRKRSATDGTPVGSLTGVYSFVFNQTARDGKAFTAVWTTVGPFASMNTLVSRKAARVGESASTMVAREWLLTGVRTSMFD